MRAPPAPTSTHAPEAGRALLPFSRARSHRPAPPAPAPLGSTSFGGLLWTARRRQHLRRALSEKPGPADRQTGHSIMQAAWWARGCTPAAASGLRPAGLGRRKLRSGLRALAGLHACDGVPPS